MKIATAHSQGSQGRAFNRVTVVLVEGETETQLCSIRSHCIADNDGQRASGLFHPK